MHGVNLVVMEMLTVLDTCSKMLRVCSEMYESRVQSTITSKADRFLSIIF